MLFFCSASRHGRHAYDEISLLAFLGVCVFVPYGKTGERYLAERLGSHSLPEIKLAGMKKTISRICFEITPEFEEKLKVIAGAKECDWSATPENIVYMSLLGRSYLSEIFLSPRFSGNILCDVEYRAYQMFDSMLAPGREVLLREVYLDVFDEYRIDLRLGRFDENALDSLRFVTEYMNDSASEKV